VRADPVRRRIVQACAPRPMTVPAPLHIKALATVRSIAIGVAMARVWIDRAVPSILARPATLYLTGE